MYSFFTSIPSPFVTPSFSRFGRILLITLAILAFAFALQMPNATGALAPVSLDGPTPTPTCEPNVFKASLSGSQEVPPNASTATGTATVVLSDDRTTISVDVTFTGLTTPATVAHIHGPAVPGMTAPPIIPLTDFPTTTSGTYSHKFPITPEQIEELANALTYLNIHSSTFPNGEIRGQLLGCPTTPTPTPSATISATVTPSATPSATAGGSVTPTPSATVSATVSPTATPTCEPNVFKGSLNGSQEVPPNDSSATGTATVVLSDDRTTVSVDVTFTGLTADATVAHIHGPAEPGMTAPPIIPLTDFPTTSSGTYSHEFPITPEQIEELANGLTYLNIHTSTFPNGEIRGQLLGCGATPTPTATVTPGGSVTPTATPGGSVTPSPTSTPVVTPTPSFAGSFVIGDMNVVVGNHVTFWGAQWAQHNSLSNGQAPNSFKGFAGTISPDPAECGGTWTGRNGNSSNPPMMIPEVITVIAASSITQSGSNITGDVAAIVLVQTDPGYEPNPGHAGTGTIVAIVCGSTIGDGISNISTRMRIEPGENVLIGGFIITGNNPKRVLLRALGPSLPLADRLADPILDLRDRSGQTIATNDNWIDAANAQDIIATDISPTNDLESAILTTLAPGPYTAIVRSTTNGSGMALVEAYDLDRGLHSKLINISTRGLVQTGNNVLIGGLIVLGQHPINVLLRAIGPSLPVSDGLANPVLELRNSSGALIGSNDDWRSDHETEIMATGIAPSNDLEAAILQPLAPGQYTAIVSGVNGSTGVGLVEAYSPQ